ncbi:cytochrome c oxidase subunit II [Deinococcus sp.]|uniref:cytochrome c oxidase subunit II n=1 Tax=Deinococcus sp. TaxID=47478 RepID=UPI0025BE523F|nr:cytochrome c oxidase subunit II [Deinococcus sp.]
MAPRIQRLDHHTMEKYENIWFGIAVVMSVLLAVAVFASFLSGTIPRIEDEGGGGHHLEGVKNGRINSRNFAGTPFATPGLVDNKDGTYSAFVVARAFAFDPPVLKVPAGKPVTFYLTSADVLHGYYVEKTNVNATVVPGQVASFTTTFRSPGPLNIVCDEYCGVGHHNMLNKIIVEAPQP